MSQLHCPDPTAFERVQYVKALQTYTPIWKALEHSEHIHINPVSHPQTVDN